MRRLCVYEDEMPNVKDIIILSRNKENECKAKETSPLCSLSGLGHPRVRTARRDTGTNPGSQPGFGRPSHPKSTLLPRNHLRLVVAMNPLWLWCGGEQVSTWELTSEAVGDVTDPRTCSCSPLKFTFSLT